jgi:hypothetical protein
MRLNNGARRQNIKPEGSLRRIRSSCCTRAASGHAMTAAQMAQPAGRNARFEFGDPLLQRLAMASPGRRLLVPGCRGVLAGLPSISSAASWRLAGSIFGTF